MLDSWHNPMQALCLLLLPLQELVKLYLHSLAAGAVAVAFLIATSWVEEQTRREKEPVNRDLDIKDFLVVAARRHLCPIASYVTLTSMVSWCCGLSDPVLSRLVPSCYILPIIFHILGGSLPMVEWLTRVVSGFFVLATTLYVGKMAGKAFLYLYHTYLIYSLVREVEGSLTLLLLTTRRMLEVPVLLLYWLALFSSQLWSNMNNLQEKKYAIQDADWMVHLLVAVSEICESPLVLVATCIVLMIISSTVLAITRRLLAFCGGQVGAGGAAVQAGMTEGVVAFVLALQTGLIEIEMPARIGAFSIILFVVIASLLQSCLDTTQPVLLSLPATNRKWVRHLPALALSLALLTLPLLMVHGLLTKVSSDLWTLVIISSCLVTAVQALGSLLTYLLFVWDSSLPTPSPNIDDYVYYVKAATRTGELMLAVAVVACGFYESLSESREWSVINSVVLIVHCYFNIYTRITQGWASYLSRRQTSMRLSELEPASSEELTMHGDVCSICYQEMVEGAVRTECKHYFHTHCLRRWLVVQVLTKLHHSLSVFYPSCPFQDNCPMCTQAIVAKKEDVKEERPADLEEEEEDREAASVRELVEEIWEELDEVGDGTDEEFVEDVEEEDEDVGLKEDEAVPDVGGDVGLRQRTVRNGQHATVSCLFDGD